MDNSRLIKKNYILNLIYEIVTLAVPLITAPYVSRVLGSVGVGQYSFTASIVSYFVILGNLGFTYYAQREIASCQGDTLKQSKIFWEIVIVKIVSTIISLAIYISLIVLNVYEGAYVRLMWILTINVVSVMFDITFFFKGNEKFGLLTIRNLIVKAVGVIAIFVFVKDENDVWIYVLCQSIILIASQLSLWPSLIKKVTFINPKKLEISKHVVPSLRLFIPTIAVSVYTILDKTLIGVLVPNTIEKTLENGEVITERVSDMENGYYEQSEKIVKMAMSIITSLGTVMIPRNSQAISSDNKELFYENVKKALRFVSFLGIPIMFGIAGISLNFSAWFFGPGYEKVPYLMIIFSPIIVLIGLSNVLGLQYLIPLKKDKKYTIAVAAGALTNAICNICLIYFFWSYGAAIATVIAEAIVTILMFYFAREDVSFLGWLKTSWKNLVGGAIMFVPIFFLSMFFDKTIVNTLLLIIMGLVLYLLVMILLKENTIIELLKRIRKKRDN